MNGDITLNLQDDCARKIDWRIHLFRLIFYVDYSPFQHKTLPRKMPFYRAVILCPSPWNLEFCSLFGWFEFEPWLHFTALNMTYLCILLLLILFWWRRWWWRWRRRRRRRRRRDDVVPTTSWRRRRDEDVFDVDYSPFQPKTLPRKMPFYRVVILSPPPLKHWVLFFICVIWIWTSTTFNRA